MSSGRPSSVVRPAQYTGPERSTPVRASASAKVTARPTGTSTPEPRSTRAKATAIRSASAGAAGSLRPRSGTALDGRADDVGHAVAPHPLLVFPVLEQRAERHFDGVLVEGGAAKGAQRHGPVDGLGHARRPVQLKGPAGIG